MSSNIISGLVVFAICAIIAVVLLVVGYKKYSEGNNLIKNGIKVEGKVVEIEEKVQKTGRGRYTTYYYPIVAFTTEDGRGMRVKTSDSSGFTVGQEVSILYKASNPEKAEIEGSRAFSLLNFYFIAGLIVFGMGGFWGVKSAISKEE